MSIYLAKYTFMLTVFVYIYIHISGYNNLNSFERESFVKSLFQKKKMSAIN